MSLPDPAALRAALDNPTGARPRDLAAELGVSEAHLVAANVGRTVTRIAAAPDILLPKLAPLRDLMGLTRNDCAVHERTSPYETFEHNRLTGPEIELRIAPEHWVHGFAIKRAEGAKGPERSFQVFDAEGQAVHKIYPRSRTDLADWDRVAAELATKDGSDVFDARALPKPQPATAARLADLVAAQRLDRVAALRAAGQDEARALAPEALNSALEALGGSKISIELTVANRGVSQIHRGPVERIQPMGPWQNVLDPRFNLHLRADLVAALWSVPLAAGHLALDAFESAGQPILTLSSHGADPSAFAELVSALPLLEPVP
ncbi:MAG: ChuX/HutX family heme-like substrate-binding protein [Pseudomonadota bacterium]